MDFSATAFRLPLIRALREFVEIDTGLNPKEPEIVFGAGWRGGGFLANAYADCPGHRLLKGTPRSRARLFNNSARSSASVRAVRIYDIIDASTIDVKT